MPQPALWAVDHEGGLLCLSSWHSNWMHIKGQGMSHFKKVSGGSWGLWAVGSDHQAYLMVHKSEVKIRYQELVYENERWNMLTGYSSSHLSKRDPRRFHVWAHPHVSISLADMRLPSSRWIWEDDWRTKDNVNGEPTDMGGWQYGSSFHQSEFSSTIAFNSYVRRRQWYRHRRFIALDRWLLIPLEMYGDVLVDICVGGEALPNQLDGFMVVWATSLDGKLLYRDDVHRRRPEGWKWTIVDIPGNPFVVSASVSPLGDLWVCTDEGQLLARTDVSWQTPYGLNWQRVNPPVPPHEDAIVQLAVGVRGVWALSNTGRYWFLRSLDASPHDPGVALAKWTSMVGRLRYIAVGPDDQVWAIDSLTDRLVYRTGVTESAPSGKVWRPLSLPIVGTVKAPFDVDDQDEPEDEWIGDDEVEVGRDLTEDLSCSLSDLSTSELGYICTDIDVRQCELDRRNLVGSLTEPLTDISDTIKGNLLADSMDVPSLQTSELGKVDTIDYITPILNSPTSDNVSSEHPTLHCDSNTPASNSDTISPDLPDVIQTDCNAFFDSQSTNQPPSLRSISASSLYISQTFPPPVWTKASFDGDQSLSDNQRCSTPKSGTPDLSSSRKTSVRRVWRKDILTALRKRDAKEFKNADFVNYPPALGLSSWKKTSQCLLLSIDGESAASCDLYDRSKWREGGIVLQQWRDGENLGAIIKLEYSKDKKEVVEIINTSNLSCQARLLPNTPPSDPTQGPIFCLALYSRNMSAEAGFSGLQIARNSRYHNTSGSKSHLYFTCGTSGCHSKLVDAAALAGKAFLLSDDEESEEETKEEESSPKKSPRKKPRKIITHTSCLSDCFRSLIRFSTEQDLEEWMEALGSVVGDQCEGKGDKDHAWIITEAGQLLWGREWEASPPSSPLEASFRGPCTVTATPPHLQYTHVGGHLSKVESGWGGVVTWALGFNAIAWVIPACLGDDDVEASYDVMINRAFPQRDVRSLYTFENQRWKVFRGFTGSGYLFDPYMWSDETGLVSRTKDQVVLPSRHATWSSTWQIDRSVLGGCSPDGWQFANNFNSVKFEREKRSNHYVRRRKWIRDYRITASGPWQEVGPFRLRDISVMPRPGLGDIESAACEACEVDVWAVSAQGEILRRRGVTKRQPQGISWVHIPGQQRFLSISVSPHHDVWTIGEDGSAFIRRGVSSTSEGFSWAHVGTAPDGCPLKQISAGGSRVVCCVDVKGRLWKRVQVQPVLPEGTEWVLLVNGGVVSVSCGPNKIWCVFSNRTVNETCNLTDSSLPSTIQWTSALRGLVTYASVRGTQPS